MCLESVRFLDNLLQLQTTTVITSYANPTDLESLIIPN